MFLHIGHDRVIDGLIDNAFFQQFIKVQAHFVLAVLSGLSAAHPAVPAEFAIPVILRSAVLIIAGHLRNSSVLAALAAARHLRSIAVLAALAAAGHLRSIAVLVVLAAAPIISRHLREGPAVPALAALSRDLPGLLPAAAVPVPGRPGRAGGELLTGVCRCGRDRIRGFTFLFCQGGESCGADDQRDGHPQCKHFFHFIQPPFFSCHLFFRLPSVLFLMTRTA